MWRSVLLGVVLAGMLAGCRLESQDSAGTKPASGDGIPQYGVIEGRVVTTGCGGLYLSGGCGPTPYRGSLVFCRTMNQIGPCPSARVDADGRYRIALPGGRYALLPAPGAGNEVEVTPRWVSVGSGRTTTLDIDGGSLTD
jgi:hypothetical protein